MKVYIGDITLLKVEVVVNAADTDFTPGGGVARWIAKQGGKEIFDEAVKYSPGEVGKVYVTNAGDLKAKKVFHIPTVNWKTKEKLQLPEIHTTCTIAMQEAIKLGLNSIIFPLLGAGTVGLDEIEVAREISEAIVHMEEENKKFVGYLSLLNKRTYEKVKEVLPKCEVIDETL